MICPFLKTSEVNCVYLDDNFCHDLKTNTGNGDAWCLRMMNIGINVKNIKVCKIKLDAFEFSVDYKPWERDLHYTSYAEHGFQKGQKELIKTLLKNEPKKQISENMG